MLQTVEVDIDASGHIHPLEPLPFKPVGRALLTLLEPPTNETPTQAETETVGKLEARGFDSLFGILKATHSVSLEEMEIGIRQHAKCEFL